MVLMLLLVARVVTKKNHVLKNVYILSAIKSIVGIQKTNVLNFGIFITVK